MSPEDNAGKPAVAAARWPYREVIGPPRCPIMVRWTLVKVRGRKLLLHHFLPNADDRAEHDHPAPFWTFVLWGGYDDRVPCPVCDGTRYASHRPSEYQHRDDRVETSCGHCGALGYRVGDRMRPGMLRKREAVYRHRTRVLPSGAWTIVLMGRKERPWGFWKDGRWWPWRQHERAFGFGMRCPGDDDR